MLPAHTLGTLTASPRQPASLSPCDRLGFVLSRLPREKAVRQSKLTGKSLSTMRGTWDAVHKVIQRRQSGSTRQRKIHRLQCLIYSRLTSANTGTGLGAVGYRKFHLAVAKLSDTHNTASLCEESSKNKHMTAIRTHKTDPCLSLETSTCKNHQSVSRLHSRWCPSTNRL